MKKKDHVLVFLCAISQAVWAQSYPQDISHNTSRENQHHAFQAKQRLVGTKFTRDIDRSTDSYEKSAILADSTS